MGAHRWRALFIAPCFFFEHGNNAEASAMGSILNVVVRDRRAESEAGMAQRNCGGAETRHLPNATFS